MELKTQIKKYGGTLFMKIPPALIEYLNIKEDDIMIMQDEKGKHGKFFSAWKK